MNMNNIQEMIDNLLSNNQDNDCKCDTESIKEETVNAKAPVSRKVYSAFAKSESISEEKSGRKTFSWFKGQIAQHKFYIIICNVNEVLEKGINGETQNGKI